MNGKHNSTSTTLPFPPPTSKQKLKQLNHTQFDAEIKTAS